MSNDKIIHEYCEKGKWGSMLLLGGLFGCIIFIFSPWNFNGNIETIAKIILFLFFFYLAYYHFLNTISLWSIKEKSVFESLNLNFSLSLVLTLVIFIFSIYLLLNLIR